MDRNRVIGKRGGACLVALRKESVDRNIGVGTTRDRRGVVALRKESVDRNKAIILAARLQGVALRKESVDRNASIIT